MFDENYNRFRMKILSFLYDCNLSESERERILAKMDEKKVKNDDLSKIYKEDFYEFCKRMLYMLNASGFSIPQCRRIITKINEEKAISDNPKTDKEKREREASERILSTPPNNDKSKDTQDKHGRPIQDEKEKRIDKNAGGENGMSFADELRKSYKTPEEIDKTEYSDMIQRAVNDVIVIIKKNCKAANSQGKRKVVFHFSLSHSVRIWDAEGEGYDSFDNRNIHVRSGNKSSNAVQNNECNDVLNAVNKELATMGFDECRIIEVTIPFSHFKFEARW